MKKIRIINSSYTTEIGAYDFVHISIEQAKALLEKYEYFSCVQFQPVATFLSDLLEIPIKCHEKGYIPRFKQTEDEFILCFRLLGKIDKGKILNIEEMKKMGYELLLLILKKKYSSAECKNIVYRYL